MIHENQSRLIQRLEQVIEQTGFGWSLCLVGEDQSKKLAGLTRDLSRPFSADGDGKRVSSGYSYWGIEPTIAWEKACHDRFYLMMRESEATFPRRWNKIQRTLAGEDYHYVCLGPGTGEKDSVVLRGLRASGFEPRYVPIDMSSEMLRLAAQEVVNQGVMAPSGVLPIQLDFNVQSNITELRRLIDLLFPDEPVLYSLLGNTAANFDDDVEMVGRLTRTLLRDQDRFLIEVATTQAVSDAEAQEAADEYAYCEAFRAFVASALHQHTDLTIDLENIEFIGSVEDADAPDGSGRALLVRVLYRNSSGETVRMTLADNKSVRFLDGDTIRLYMTRKYLRPDLPALFGRSDVVCLDAQTSDFEAPTLGTARFGTDLLLLRRDTGEQPQDVMELIMDRPAAR